MATSTPPERGVKTTYTVVDIIETIHSLEGASLAELDSHLNYAKSTIHDHLKTLEATGYVVFEHGEYVLSLKFLHHGVFARNNKAVSQNGQIVIEELADRTGEAVWIIVEENEEAVYLYNANGSNAVRTHAEVGRRSNLHHLAAGKQILAYMDPERVDEIIDRTGLDPVTPNTITDRGQLKTELATIRENQVSYNDQETVNGVRAIAAPVLNGTELVCAICVSGPANRMTLERCEATVKPALLEATNELELRIQYPEG